LLNRLQIPQAQKLLFENYWDANPKEKRGRSVLSFFLLLIRPMIIGAFAAPYFMAGTKPFVNIALVLLWVIYPIVTLLHIIIVGGICFSAAKDEDKTLDRVCASFLPGANSRLKRAYSTLSWFAIFGLTASDGYFITSGMVALCWIAAWILNTVCEGSIKKFLTRAARMPAVRVINTTAGRID
jgi:hypothetical protein